MTPRPTWHDHATNHPLDDEALAAIVEAVNRCKPWPAALADAVAKLPQVTARDPLYWQAVEELRRAYDAAVKQRDASE